MSEYLNEKKRSKSSEYLCSIAPNIPLHLEYHLIEFLSTWFCWGYPQRSKDDNSYLMLDLALGVLHTLSLNLN